MAEAVTVIVATMGSLPRLMAVNEGTFPVPEAGNPIAGLEFVQLYVTPAGVPVKKVAGTTAPSKTDVSLRTTTVGSGFTVTVNVAVLAHCPAAGVKV